MNTFKKGDPLAVIYNEGSWRISKVSPLNNLQYNSVKLKQYASKIRQRLVSSTQTLTSARYCVQFEAQPHLKYCEQDPDSLIITVNTSSETKNVHNNPKVLYAAILLAWGVNSTLRNATHLPYLLERGEQKLGTVVKTTLQATFDCIIKSFCFTQHQLLHIGFSFLEHGSPRSNDPFTLGYKNLQAEQKDRLSLTFNAGDVLRFWDGIRDTTSNSKKQVKLTYTILQNQIFHSMKLDITMFDLCDVTLPKAEVKSNGVVKMKTPDIVNSLFITLNETSNDTQVNSETSSSIHSQMD